MKEALGTWALLIAAALFGWWAKYNMDAADRNFWTILGVLGVVLWKLDRIHDDVRTTRAMVDAIRRRYLQID